MVKRTTPTQKYVAHDVLRRELSAAEHRFDAKIENVEKILDAKIESTGLSFKEYVDARWKQLDVRFGARFDAVDRRFD